MQHTGRAEPRRIRLPGIYDAAAAYFGDAGATLPGSEPSVRQRDGSSDRRWIILTDDGAVSTLGRATSPTEEELRRIEIQSHSFDRAQPASTFMVIQRLGQLGLPFDDVVATVRALLRQAKASGSISFVIPA